MSDDAARKIGALLAKAERTDNPHEAEAYTRKAENLMVKLGIEEAVARAAAGGEVKPEAIVERFVRVAVDVTTLGTWRPAGPNQIRPCAGACGADLPARRSPTMKEAGIRGAECRKCRDARTTTATAALNAETNAYNREHVTGWHAVSRALGANGFYVGSFTGYYAVGFESDVDRIAVLVTSLKAQVTMALWTWWRAEGDAANAYATDVERVSARRDFVVSFYVSVAARLRTRTQEATDATPGASLALRDKAAEVKEHMETKALKAARGRSYSGSGAGARAGASANLGGNAVGGGHKALSR